MRGRKPRNWKRSVSSPEQHRAVMAAQAPGMGLTAIFWAMQAWMSWVPGSEIPGVPASEMSPIVFPLRRSSMISFSLEDSLNLWKLLRGFEMWWWFKRI